MADDRRPDRRTRLDAERASRAVRRSPSWGPRPVMWAAIVLSVVLFVLLSALGWGDGAASLAGALLLLACVAVCTWAAVQGRMAEREVDRAVGQITRIRRGQSPVRD